MIILASNVLSELMRPVPAEIVLAWLAGQPVSTLHVTSVSYAEIRVGIGLLPEGRRRRGLAEQVEAMFVQDFAGRVLSFDLAAAAAFADISVRRRQSGTRIEPIDAMIAAIAKAHGAAVATRDSDLGDCGVPVINPWRTA